MNVFLRDIHARAFITLINIGFKISLGAKRKVCL